MSLASKFAHFYLDPRRFPIYDELARRTLAKHTGRTLTALEHSYAYYCETFNELAARVCQVETPRRLDRYLWIQGQFDEFKRTGKPRNSELGEAFRAGLWPPNRG